MERWVEIAEFPDYSVSSEGRVKRTAPDYRGRFGNVLKPYMGRYAALTLYIDHEPYTVHVHVLVCTAFHGQRPTPEHEVAHSDGNCHHNHCDNLRWATRIENNQDKIAHGTSLAGRPSWVPIESRPRGLRNGRYTMPERTARGERSSHSKLTEAKVIAIRLDGRPRKEIAQSYGVTVATVGHIKRGRTWTHVPVGERA